MRLFLAVFGFFSALSLSAHGDAIRFGELQLDDAWIKAPLPGQPVTGGYLKIENNGQTDEVLIGVAADFALTSELHEMKMFGDVMKMRPLENGLLIPAGGKVYLKPGGHHLMFMKLNRKLQPMETYNVTLSFRNSGSVVIPMQVHTMASGMKHGH